MAIYYYYYFVFAPPRYIIRPRYDLTKAGIHPSKPGRPLTIDSTIPSSSSISRRSCHSRRRLCRRRLMTMPPSVYSFSRSRSAIYYTIIIVIVLYRRNVVLREQCKLKSN